MRRYAIITIGTDGATSIAGPYTSEVRARRHADRLAVGGVAADVYEMESPTETLDFLNYRETQ